MQQTRKELRGGIDLTITVEVRKGNLKKAMEYLRKKYKKSIVRLLKQKQYYEKGIRN